jgi:hypothetical protein
MRGMWRWEIGVQEMTSLFPLREFWGREGGRQGSGNGEDKRGERKISESQRSGTAVD